MRHLILASLVLTGLGCQSIPASSDHEEVTRYVDPLIGTAQATTARILGRNTETYAQTIPVVSAPHGMTGWTPQTRTTEKKCQAPYYYSDSLLTGIRGTHWLNGSCVQDYGSLTIMPLEDPERFRAKDRGIRLDHTLENAQINQYSFASGKSGLSVSVSTTDRCGILSVEWREPGPHGFVIEPNSDENQASIRIDSSRQRIVVSNPVHRIYQGWGESAGFSGHFVLEFDQPFTVNGIYDSATIYSGRTSAEHLSGLGALISFSEEASVVHVRVGSSFFSPDAATENLRQEIPHWSLEQVADELEQTWNSLLGRVLVSGEDKQKRIFYTGLYRSFLHPRLYSDAGGSYPSFGGNLSPETAEGFRYYDDFSTWDTYRAVHPLHNLLAPEYSQDFVQSLIRKAQAGGWMPIFPCWNSYTAAMIGDHLSSVIADAYVKEIDIPMIDTAYAYLRKNAFETPVDPEEYRLGKGRRALESYLTYGYIPLEDKVPDAFHKQEQVSRTLEYAYDDFCLARIAEGLGKEEDQILLDQRAKSYQQVYDPRTGYVNGRYANGMWAEDFELNGDMEYITEGTPWHYSWYVPHDVPGLISIMGGDSAFVSRLDSFFAAGAYWHGNEPCHQTYFLYNYTSQPWKSQQISRQILREDYHGGPGGLSGNEDGGQMSAWMVFSSMGMYPVCPGTTQYALVTPVFEEVKILLPSGKTWTIQAPGSSDEQIYIQDVRINGEPLSQMFIDHMDIQKGGTLELTLAEHPVQ